MSGIYLIIGGNMGDRENYLSICRQFIKAQIGDILQQSKIYETAAWGETDNPAFLNQVLHIDAELSPSLLLQQCLMIEKQMGRIRDRKWGSRIIDIDILFYREIILKEAHLKIPHPHLPERRFVLLPLHEIAPSFLHPVFRKNIAELLALCTDPLAVSVFKEK